MALIVDQGNVLTMPETSCATFTLEKTCRLCLSQGGVLSAIFQEDVDEPGFISLPAKIEACVNVEVIENYAFVC